MRNQESGQPDAPDISTDLEYELDALANKDVQYLTKTCLPRKLKEIDWLD